MDCHSCIDIGLAGREEDEIFIGYCDVGDSIEEKNWIISILFGGNHLGAVVLDFSTGDIIFESSVDENLAFDIDEDH